METSLPVPLGHSLSPLSPTGRAWPSRTADPLATLTLLCVISRSMRCGRVESTSPLTRAALAGQRAATVK